MSLRQKIKRPGLDWLSREEVAQVRNRILTLYLAPGEALRVAPPTGSFGLDPIQLFGGVAPCFVITTKDLDGKKAVFKFWLKIPKDKNPLWQLETTLDDKVTTYEDLRYKDPRAKLPRSLVLSFSWYFPFLPTENFLQKGGDFVA